MSLDDGINLPSTSLSGCDSLKSLIDSSLSEHSREKITSIVNDVNKLTDIEKLLLYLQLPTAKNCGADSQKSKVGVGKRADVEISQTYAWIKTHLEEDVTVSLPKQEVYEDYRRFCVSSKFEPMCVADFGKAMKHIFPSVKPRRLGQRGNSKYCYSGLRKKFRVDTPDLPLLDIQSTLMAVQKSKKDSSLMESSDDVFVRLVLAWAEKLTECHFPGLPDLAAFLVKTQRIDPQVFSMDTAWLKSFKQGKEIKQEKPRKRKPSTNGSSSCSALQNLGCFTGSMDPVPKVPIPRTTTANVKSEFSLFRPPVTSSSRTVIGQSSKEMDSRSITGPLSAEVTNFSYEFNDDSTKRRHSLSAPSTLVSSPQFEPSFCEFNSFENSVADDQFASGSIEETLMAPNSNKMASSDGNTVDDFANDDLTTNTLLPQDGGSEKISQLRELLERNLPQKTEAAEEDPANQLQGYQELRENMQRKSVSSYMDVGRELAAQAGQYFSRQTQYPSLPVSPSQRRATGDFTFQPIPIENNGNPVTNQFSIEPHIPMNSQMQSNYQVAHESVAVGPSQPPSGANSPFLSPRDTPTSCFQQRSRHNSGQSAVSLMRQTPFTLVDSGISSIASSPFISPQTTPVPHRVRTGSGPLQRCATSRARHSSGPGLYRQSSMSFMDSLRTQTIQGTMQPHSSFAQASNFGVEESRFPEFHGKVTTGRHRHLSSPYSCNMASYTTEDLKNFFRSQSVPVPRDGFMESALQSVPENQAMKSSNFELSSNVTMPPSPMDESSSKTVSQDVMMSGLKNTWSQGSARRNINDLLEAGSSGDDLQTAIEDLRDLDNDYSEFEQLIAYSDAVPLASDLV